MFARTERLFLRPGWIEDAPELARAIGHEAVVRNLGRAPWPYALGDAQTMLANVQPAHVPSFLILEVAPARPARIVGGMGIGAYDDRPHELGYWIAPDAWGRGYATEAGRAVLAIARALDIPQVTAGHYLDNPASGAVLRKLGFRPTGCVEQAFSRGRGENVPCARYEISLGDMPEERTPMAA